MWDNLQDAQMRAKHTVVRYNDKPVYIKNLDSRGAGIIAYFFYLSNGNNNEAMLDDPKWNWKPVPTGMVNTNTGVHYLQRVPCRKYKQGLYSENVRINPAIPGVRPDSLLRSKNFARTVMREYPKYQEALSRVQEKVGGVAFHQEFAVLRGKIGPTWLVYRTDQVGWFENGQLRLGEGWGFLRELVQEVTNENVG